MLAIGTTHSPPARCTDVVKTLFLLQVLNDFVAIGYAVPLLEDDGLIAINDAPRTPGGPIAVLGPGTGLGEVQLVWDRGVDDYVAYASEGSHAGFAPRGALQVRLRC